MMRLDAIPRNKLKAGLAIVLAGLVVVGAAVALRNTFFRPTVPQDASKSYLTAAGLRALARSHHAAGTGPRRRALPIRAHKAPWQYCDTDIDLPSRPGMERVASATARGHVVVIALGGSRVKRWSRRPGDEVRCRRDRVAIIVLLIVLRWAL